MMKGIARLEFDNIMYLDPRLPGLVMHYPPMLMNLRHPDVVFMQIRIMNE